MPSEFIADYCENLRKLGFNVTAGNNRYSEVQMAAGQAANIGVIVDADEFNPDELAPFVNEYSQYVEQRSQGARLSNIFLLFVLVGTRPREDLDELLFGGDAFENQRFYKIYWSVTLAEDDCRIEYNKNQPDELGGMRKTLESTFKNERLANALEPITGNIFMTYILQALNGTVFALMGLTLPRYDPHRMVTAGAILPELVLSNGEYWRLAAAMFIHFDLMHLAANCLGIYVFGGIVERFVGSFKFMLIYLLSGLFASALCLTQANTVSAGASGAVFGLIGALAVIAWRARGRAYFNLYNLSIFIVISLGMSFIVPGISYVAHIGGLIAGIALGFPLSSRRPAALQE